MSEEDEAVDEFTTAARGDAKYLLLKVPHFALDPSGDPSPSASLPAAKAAERRGRYHQEMTSYLRLGTMKVDDHGDDLIQHAFDAGPAGKKEGSPFIDDERNRGDGSTNPSGADGHGLTAAERVALHTRFLKTKGGWRDHSDGNRITTTYGDKVEVVRGNYKMVVMGRQDDPGNGIGWDASGNHLQDYAQATMPGASVSVEWIQNAYVPNLFPSAAADTNHTQAALILGGSASTVTPVALSAEPGDEFKGGAWLLINSTERVYQYSRNAGNFRTQQWGDCLQTYTGSENPARIGKNDGDGYAGHPDDAAYHTVAAKNYTEDDMAARLRPSSKGLPRGNPHIIEKTWASRIESYTGSEKLRIPSVYESTWVTTSDSHEDILTKTEHSTVGTQTSTTRVTTLTETTTVDTQVSTTYAGAIVDTTIVGATNSTTLAAAIGDITISPTRLSVEAIGLEGKAELGYFKWILTMANGKEWKFGEILDMRAAPKKTISADELKLIISESNYTLSKKRCSLEDRTVALMCQYKAIQLFLGS